MRTKGLGLAAVIGLTACAVSAFAGGFWLEVDAPDLKNPRTRNAAVVFHAEGCHGPGSSITGTAEGIVNGKRRSIPLKIQSVGNETFTVTRQWPRDGRWVLAVTASSTPWTHNGKTHQARSSAVVQLTESGALLVSAPRTKGERPTVAVRRPERETLAQLVEATLKDSVRQAAL